MKWVDVVFYGTQTVGKDRLNNPITQPVELGQYRGRLTEWSPEEVELYGREMTVSYQKLQTKAPLSVVEKTDTVAVDGGDSQKVKKIISGSRWRILHIKRYRT